MSQNGGESSPSSKWPGGVLLLLVVAVSGGIIFWFSNQREKPSEAEGSKLPAESNAAIETSQPDLQPSLTPQFQPPDPSVTVLPGAEELGNLLHDPESEPKADLDAIQDLLQIFRRANDGSNPSGGENEEIMAGLLGKNPAKMSFLPFSHPALSGEGKLLDRWGTPYWFHPVSRDFLEVRSAGPDRTLFTEDDIMTETPDETGADN